jgi:TolA-binding protein
MTASAPPRASAAPSATAEEPPTASALFARAGDARQHGAYADAIRSYEELTRAYPQSNEAANAHAFLGRLLLDRGDASGALTHFDAYLRGGAGALREDAMAGRAVALGQLGRAQDEAAAWNALLAAYPQSVHAARARARLAALENR